MGSGQLAGGVDRAGPVRFDPKFNVFLCPPVHSAGSAPQTATVITATNKVLRFRDIKNPVQAKPKKAGQQSPYVFSLHAMDMRIVLLFGDLLFFSQIVKIGDGR